MASYGHGRDRPRRPYYDNHADAHDRHTDGPRAYERRTPPYDQHRASDRFADREDQHGGDYRDTERDHYRRERSPPRQSARHRYRDRDHESYRSPDRQEYRSPGRHDRRSPDRQDRHSPDRDSRGRSRSHSRTRSRSQRSRSPHYGGPPSKDVMLDALPPNMFEEDISKELSHSYGVNQLEAIRVIRDRNTKQSRGFGFLRFPSVDSARAFVERNFPTIRLSYRASATSDQETVNVRIAYSREREDRGRGDKAEADWTCRICNFINFSGRRLCFKCHSPLEVSNPPVAATKQQPEAINNGESDIAPDNAPSQFLLLRALETSVTEELLAKGVAKLYKPSASQLDSAPKSTKKANAKVASTTGDANLGAKEGSICRVMVVRDRATNESWRYGFAEFATVEDAQAALTRYNSFERFTIASKPVEVSFIHAGVFVPVLDPDAGHDDETTFASSMNPAMRLQYWDENAYIRELVVNSFKPAVSAPDDAPGAAGAAADRGRLVTGEDEDAKQKKRKAEAKGSERPKKAVPAHLQFWSNRHAELHGLPQKTEAEAPDNAQDSAPVEDRLAAVSVASKKPNSYADMNRLCCYLCLRQFKTATEVNKHERLSELHRTNLEKPELHAKAMKKLLKAGINPLAPEYRDRARERRQAFGPSKISLPMKKDRKKEPTPPTEEPGVPSKGAALLGKMGWSEGQGLGAQGTGMKAPIATDVYAAGVGLGAQGGKIGDAVVEAGKNTKDSYADFVERARDKAKERFQQLS